MAASSRSLPGTAPACSAILTPSDTGFLCRQACLQSCRQEVAGRGKCSAPCEAMMMMMISHLFQPHQADQMFDPGWILCMQALTLCRSCHCSAILQGRAGMAEADASHARRAAFWKQDLTSQSSLLQRLAGRRGQACPLQALVAGAAQRGLPGSWRAGARGRAAAPA